VTFQEEHWSEFCVDAQHLFPLHWKELALNQEVIPLEPDHDLYNAIDRSGQLMILTARDGAGKLLGYNVYFVRTHMHYMSCKVAMTDMYFVLPEHRSGVGVKLFIEAEKRLKARGVRLAITSCKVHEDHEKLFTKLGWKFSDKTFVKYIGN
jgi:hypothetical protein